MLKSDVRATKHNFGKWEWSEEAPFPQWEAVATVPLWSDPEWQEVRVSLSRPLTETFVKESDSGKVSTVWLNAVPEGQEPSGPHVDMATLVTGKAIPTAISGKEYDVVCLPKSSFV